MAVVSSAEGLLALLREDEPALQLHALQSLNRIVHEFWYQISSVIASVEALYEDEDFSHRELAALLVSKVFYHLGELDDALTYALGAGSLFDTSEQSEYVHCIIAKGIDEYVELRTKSAAQGDSLAIDERLTAIIERMFERCYRDGQFEQAVGIALESRRLDKLEETIRKSPDIVKTLTYSLGVCQKLVVSREVRQQVLRLLIKLYESVENPDWVNICQCLMFLDDPLEVAKILDNLLKGSEDDALLAYQVCFDLFANEMQSFLLKAGEHLALLAPRAPAPAPTPAADGAPAAAPSADGADGEAMETDQLLPAVAAPAAVVEVPKAVQQYLDRHQKVKKIVSGEVPISLYLEFLFSHNHADLQILKNTKTAIEVRNSVCHSALIFSNAVMHSGTTVDSFLRENLEWLSRATNWAKFSATAGLGVIHRGHLAQGKALMGPYLPRNGATGSPYSEGGALYALGLIHANHSQDIRDFLLESLRATSHETIQHGACLGLGLAALGTNDEEVFEDIKGVLFLDSAVAGEAAGLALGLLCVGSASDHTSELLAYAHDTQHEKIIRGLAMGLALMMYGREEGAEPLIESMSRDQDPILRYGGMFVIGMAYRGTANNAAIQKLLHFAVSDVSDDVRRAAVLNLGFLLMATPEQCPRIVSLLSESYNPHVRYGAAMAVGVCCAGTGQKDALDLLQPLMNDATAFVRQGALIATAMVLIQQPESKVAAFRKQLEKLITAKHGDVMARMGAIMASGILDSGGRNVTIAVQSHSGYFRRSAVVGLAVFTQYWYWYPLSYFLTLAFAPTALIGLNSDLKMPKLQVACNAKASLFAYPPPVTQETSVAVSKAPTAVLSTTVRAKEKQKKKDAEKGKAEPSAAAAAPAAAAPEGGPAAMETDGEAPKEVQKKKEEPEPSSFTLENPARVLPQQEKFVAFPANTRFAPIRAGRHAGIIVLKDSTPGESVELVSGSAPEGAASQQPAAPAAAAAPAEEQEPPPPEAFDYVP